MKRVQRFGVKRKLAPRYVGPYPIIKKSGRVAYMVQLPPEMGAVFNVFHVSQLKKCLRVLEERVEVRDIKLKSDLAYEEKLVQIIDNKDRVTWNRVIKFHKVMWNNHSEQHAMWEQEDSLREVYLAFYEKWYVFRISGRDFYKGERL